MFKKMIAAAVTAATLAATAQGAAPTTPTTEPHASERACLVAAAWNEARGRPSSEIAAVMHVVLNRSEHPAYPHTVCGVVMEKGQFQMDARFRAAVAQAKKTGHFALKGLRDKEQFALERMDAIAVMVIDGTSVDATSGATHFYCPQLRRLMGLAAMPSWAKRMPMSLSLGEFRFHRMKA